MKQYISLVLFFSCLFSLHLTAQSVVELDLKKHDSNEDFIILKEDLSAKQIKIIIKNKLLNAEYEVDSKYFSYKIDSSANRKIDSNTICKSLSDEIDTLKSLKSESRIDSVLKKIESIAKKTNDSCRSLVNQSLMFANNTVESFDVKNSPNKELTITIKRADGKDKKVWTFLIIHEQIEPVISPKHRLFITAEGILKSSSDVENVEATGYGRLGVSFESYYFYGKVLFNVVNRNDEIVAVDSTETKVFTNNLLIPDNSGQGISNFNINGGIKSFAKKDEDWSKVKTLSWKRLGVYGYWQVNNTQWTKDSISTQVYISSFGLYATYNIFSFKILSDKSFAKLYWFGGFENRILGGDYSLKQNIDYREHFLGTDQLKFISTPSVGFELRLKNFYGRLTETNFDGDLAGFSGWQTTITVGITVDLDLLAIKAKP